MKSILLYGKGNIGKSTTIRHFYDNYVKDNPLFEIEKQKIKKLDILVRAKYKERTIGIISHGDNKYCVKEGIDFVGKCDILICVSRGKGTTLKLINSISDGIVELEKPTLCCPDSTLSIYEITRIHNEQNEQTSARINELLHLVLQIV